ncbi:lysine/ornithine N-monooxygenase [Pilimelia terevasa]|uniref:L-lysine N6-monooxygenase MbtG n=1 Tax=Pilimelia terevasa TaxID=53372 RepID=A0A8J3BQE5_9ACTN|nr:SidA/IucD/PvdA family monooxygenase [Pilimelia terevasa]GGK40466.1 lysine/ornithine N-monooxygenase [Pilimelia terevasa]
MSQPLPAATPPVFDLIGVGFGPSNLAMAIATQEHNSAVPRESAVTAHFLERQPTFGWHRGMLIDDATMQVSFLKDLVTLRNPASEYSFLCYLQSRGRLVDFINHKTLFPLRIEFHDYFEWAAAKVDDQVSYGHEVVEVRPVTGPDGAVDHLDVVARGGERPGELTVYRARNLVVGTGLRPKLPAGVTLSDRVWHSRDLLRHTARLAGTAPKRFVVVGAGQSAAETAAYLHREFPGAEVHAVFARYGYSPADDSAFANRIFDPAAVDDYFTAPEPVKRKLMDYHGNTNYAVVDIDLIDDLYRREYTEKVRGARRLYLRNVAHVAEMTDTGTGVRAVVASLVSGEQTVLEADAVVYATGYHEQDVRETLGDPLADLCQRDPQGRLAVDRDYRLRTAPALRCGIYLQGGTEHSHGITSSLLSNTAVRVGEMLESVLAERVVATGVPAVRAQSRAAFLG